MPEITDPVPGDNVPLAMGEALSKRDGQKNERMLQRAMRQGWAVPDKYRQPMVERQVAIAVNPEGVPREATAAFVALTTADLRERTLDLKEWELEQRQYLPGEQGQVAAAQAKAAAVANQTVVVNVQPAAPAEEKAAPVGGLGELSAEERLAALERMLGEFGNVAKGGHGRNGSTNGSAGGH